MVEEGTNRHLSSSISLWQGVRVFLNIHQGCMYGRMLADGCWMVDGRRSGICKKVERKGDLMEHFGR